MPTICFLNAVFPGFYPVRSIAIIPQDTAYAVLLTCIVTIILLISGLLGYRSRMRNRKSLKLKQEEIDSRDVTLDQLLKDNEWLLQELHHRVKNNLQIVTSLLHSQSMYLKDDAAVSAIMQSHHRIQAMSLIHKKVYQTGALSTVYMPEYVEELVSHLLDNFDLTGRVSCQLQVDKIRLDMVNAVPVGLILNEILTNAFKYAFPHSSEDCITVNFCNSAPNGLCLEVKDNGKGLPPDFSLAEGTSFGMMLMTGLTEQLDGIFSIENKNGTMIRMCFKDEISKTDR
jgi:two-component sensor histidine kinase